MKRGIYNKYYYKWKTTQSKDKYKFNKGISWTDVLSTGISQIVVCYTDSYCSYFGYQSIIPSIFGRLQFIDCSTRSNLRNSGKLNAKHFSLIFLNKRKKKKRAEKREWTFCRLLLHCSRSQLNLLLTVRTLGAIIWSRLVIATYNKKLLPEIDWNKVYLNVWTTY